MENLEKSRMILGVARNATQSDIKRAYRAQVRIWHPDLFHSDLMLRCTAEEKIKEINEARRVLLSFAEKDHARNGGAGKSAAGHIKSPGRQDSTTGQAAPVLIKCEVCGQLNGIDSRTASVFLCCNCGNPLIDLSLSGMRPAETRPKSLIEGETISPKPTLDHFKFFLFCAFSVGTLMLSGIGAALILWTTSNYAFALAHKYFF